MKWNMGWMHDTLAYATTDPLFRKYHHNQLTFSIWYAFYENFMLSLSHDEVVHGKRSLMAKMPGNDWEKFANMRLLFGYQFAHPGKKLLFMGMEFGQWNEWYHEASLDWHLMQYHPHQGLHQWVRHLNILYRREPALYELDFGQDGFEWADLGDWESSVISFFRKGKSTDDLFLIVCNFTPMTRSAYRIGVPRKGMWQEVLNSDADLYGGSNQGNLGNVEALPVSSHRKDFSLSMTLPPLGVVFFKHSGGAV